MGDLNKTVFFDRKMEQAVITQVFIDHNGLNTVMTKLRESSFNTKEAKTVFAIIKEMYDKQKTIDLLTVSSEIMKISDSNLRTECIGFVSNNVVASTAHIETHTDIIRELEVKRTLKALGSVLIAKAENPSISGEQTLDELQTNLSKLNVNAGKPVKSMAELGAKQLAISNGEIEDTDRFLTHMQAVDDHTQGFRGKDMVVIAARPGMGKTAWALSTAKNMAMFSNVPTEVYSFEMSADQLYQRILANESSVALTKVRNHELIKDDELSRNEIHEAAERLSTIPLYLNDQTGSSLNDVIASIREGYYKRGVRCVVIDYLQLMSDESKSGNREQEVSRISRKLKAVAKELGILMYALSQLSRQVESRGGSRRPKLSDLRESGSIEQDADVVAALWRPWYYDIREDEEGNSTINDAEMIFLKFRNGALGTAYLKFHGKYQRYCDPKDASIVSSGLFEEIRNKAIDGDLPF